MDYALRLLARHGYDHATATLCYRPQDIKSAFGEGRHGVTLRYSEEKTPLGTAGSVLHALEGDADTVLVLSGDGLTGCDLSDALRFHQRVGAAATLVLKSVDIPLAYGVVVTDERGRILRFIEKPDWSRVVSSQVNTGVYLLEREALALIPRDRPFDFGRELFPLMLQKGMPLYGYPTRAYWCDVGDPAALLRAQGDLLSGRRALSLPIVARVRKGRRSRLTAMSLGMRSLRPVRSCGARVCSPERAWGRRLYWRGPSCVPVQAWGRGRSCCLAASWAQARGRGISAA